jgi:hypothetical protein
MISGLIGLLVTILVIGIVAAILIYLIDMLPIDGRFKQIIKVLLLLIAVLIIIARALPLLGVSSGLS